MKTIVNSTSAPAPIGPYNQAVAFNGLLFVSGQVAIDPSTGDLVLENIEAETHRVLQNVKAILETAGTSLDHVLKATVFVKDIGNFGRINAIYGQYFQNETAPARELVQVSELPKLVNIEISVIAALS